MNIADENEQRDFEQNCVWEPHTELHHDLREVLRGNRPIRVSHIAKIAGVTSREVVEFLQGRGITSIKTPSSRVPEGLANFLCDFFASGKKSLAVAVQPVEDKMVASAALSLRQGFPPQHVVEALTYYVKLTGGE